MCGIFQLLNCSSEYRFQIEKGIMNGKHRGPDHSYVSYDAKTKRYNGFHRLSINGLDDISNQPIIIQGIELYCNGQIYNHSQLKHELKYESKTHSDCESIIHLYIKYGIKGLLNIIDGVYSFILIDKRDLNHIQMFIARDPFGVRPLFRSEYENNESCIAFASEMKMLKPLDEIYPLKTIHSFKPGHFEKLEYINGIWKSVHTEKYFTLHHNNSLCYTQNMDFKKALEHAKQTIRTSLMQAVEKRVQNTDREVACLLSGGLDSSLIASLVHKYSKTPVRTYSIGLKNSEDIKYAHLVADHIKSIHTDIIITEEEFLDAIPKVIYAIESYDTTTVRASVGNYLVAKYISENSDAKVIFNGDGSDEVCGGYLYFHESPNCIDFTHECKRLLTDIHCFDVLRSDRSISSHGLEARTPFLDKLFVSTYMCIPDQVRYLGMRKCSSTYNTKISEKYLLRTAFEDMNLLPNEVLWRQKEAFSDGVSSKSRSWYQIIQEHVEHMSFKSNIYDHVNPLTNEQKYYRHIFETCFNSQYANVIPYFWMPKFIKNAKDASARTLDFYDNKNE